jgi:hypothetical protein
MKRLALIAIPGWLLLASHAQAADCEAQATSAVEAAGVSDHHDYYEDLWTTTTTDSTLRYVGWFRVQRCERGYVIVNMTATCFIVGVYSIDGCHIPGLPNWSY